MLCVLVRQQQAGISASVCMSAAALSLLTTMSTSAYETETLADMSPHPMSLSPLRFKLRKHSTPHTRAAQWHEPASSPAVPAPSPNKGFFGRLIARTKSTTSLSTALHVRTGSMARSPSPPPVPPMPLTTVAPTPVAAPVSAAARRAQDAPLPRQATASSWQTWGSNAGGALPAPASTGMGTGQGGAGVLAAAGGHTRARYSHDSRSGLGLTDVRRQDDLAAAPAAVGMAARQSSCCAAAPCGGAQTAHSTSAGARVCADTSASAPLGRPTAKLQLAGREQQQQQQQDREQDGDAEMMAAVSFVSLSAGSACPDSSPEWGAGDAVRRTAVQDAGARAACCYAPPASAWARTSQAHSQGDAVHAAPAAGWPEPRKVRSTAQLVQRPAGTGGPSPAHGMRRASHMDLYASRGEGRALAAGAGCCRSPGSSAAAADRLDEVAAAQAQWQWTGGAAAGGGADCAAHVPLPPPGWRRRARSSTASGATRPAMSRASTSTSRRSPSPTLGARDAACTGGLAPRTRAARRRVPVRADEAWSAALGRVAREHARASASGQGAAAA